MDNDNQEKVFCADDAEYRLYCDICDELAIDG